MYTVYTNISFAQHREVEDHDSGNVGRADAETQLTQANQMGLTH